MGMFRSDFKNTLKNLSKYFTIIFIFKNFSKKNLFQYLLNNDFSFDACYYIHNHEGY